MAGIRQLAARTSLFYRILIASSAIVLVGAVAGTWITRALLEESSIGLIAMFVLSGVSLHVVANFWILKVALKPLESIRRTVEEVYYEGNLKARAVREPMGDPATNRLIDGVNTMLDHLAASRRELELLPARILGAQEEERKRIARELHDETSQALTSVIVGLRMLEKERSPDATREKVGQLRATVAETLEAVHGMAVELRPSALDELGLLPALRSYAKEYERKFGIKVDFQATGLRGRLPAEAEVAIYRIVQEALTNTAKYSGAKFVAVQLQKEGDGLTATVRDDGRGFDVNVVERSKSRGLGLFGMRERANLLSGELTILSAPNNGTTIVARVPINGVEEKIA